MSEPLERTGEFPRMVTRMVAVGEEAGSLEMMLQEVAHFYERDVESTVKRLTTLLEPLLTAFLAVVVGFVVLSLYLPIFGLGEAVMGGPSRKLSPAAMFRARSRGRHGSGRSSPLATGRRSAASRTTPPRRRAGLDPGSGLQAVTSGTQQTVNWRRPAVGPATVVV